MSERSLKSMHKNFQKFVYFGQIGELKTNDLMEQKESATALELVCNIAAYWNAQKISEAVEHLKGQEKMSKMMT